MIGDLTPDQKRYLEGFASGLSARAAGGLSPSGGNSAPTPMGPDAPHLLAQDAVTKAGKKLVDQEKWKREEHPFDAYSRLNDQARRDEFPKPADNFRWRYYGLFYVAPTQDSYMCRLRIPNGVLTHGQLAGIADIAEKFAGGYAHVTTRANIQMREIAAKDAIHIVESVQDLGLTSRGSGADNIRNVTGDATAGIGAHELIDTRPYARAWHFHVLNQRALTGLPRKFNVAFDGGGAIPTLEETNDIGFQAVAIADAGVAFRLVLGGITGHMDLARDTGIIVKPEETTEVADAIVRVFIAEGDRTNRTKARLKYVLDRDSADGRGFETFLARVEALLERKLTRVDKARILPRPAQDRQAHIGAHAQRQPGLFYLGIALPVGKMSAAQMCALADIARECGDGDLRLTVWQNLLISGIAEGRLEVVKARVEAAGLDWRASSIRAGLIACTGSKGCKFAASDTKGHAEDIARWCEKRITLDRPVNIHLTGCHHSCAQHYIGDIGLIGARVAVNDEGDTVDGYHVVVGGGFGEEGAIGREVLRDVKADEAPGAVERLLKSYLRHRADDAESFHAFAARHEVDALKALVALEDA
ncbi:NirA family protein [Methylocapsa sp. S129]|uniref:NirA family protein n=1 Tax=Methylocapsa sp. S129 TaxID=1641869 RepID=UPI00131C2070|nr:NirA family protein [Methylocapsa sp. S129]